MRALLSGLRPLALCLSASACAAPLHTLIDEGRTREAVERIQKGAEIEVWERSLLPIHRAAQLGQGDVVDALLDVGIQVDVPTAELGRTPLEHAALGGHVALVERLIERGADASHSPRDGVGALHLAAEFNHPGVAAALLAAGAEVDARSLEGVTPLHHACGSLRGGPSAQLTTAAVLIEQGADLGATGPGGWSVRDAAEQGGNVALQRIIRAADPEAGPAEGSPIPPERVVVEIERAVALPDAPGLAFAAGRAAAIAPAGSRLDLVLAIDVSDSTIAPAGFDVDGDGEVGRIGALFIVLGIPSITDPEDSVLHAELAAAESLIAQLDPRTSRLGIVTFSENRPEPGAPPARLVLPLSAEPESWQAALTEIRQEGSWGRTDLQAGLRAALDAVARGEAGPAGARLIAVFSDGEPTLPIETSRSANELLALAVAGQAVLFEVRIDAFSFGGGPIDTLEELALLAGGTHSVIRSEKDLALDLDAAPRGPVQRLEVRNAATGEAAVAVLLQSDGRFAALVPVSPDADRIGVEAWTHDGPSRSATARVEAAATATRVTPRERLERAVLAQRVRAPNESSPPHR